MKGEDIETIYFGGGTPSQLEKEDFEQIFDTIREHYGLNHCQEITLEANPDDLSQEYPVSYTHLDVYKRQAYSAAYLSILKVKKRITRSSRRKLISSLSITVGSEMCIRDSILASHTLFSV